MKAEGTALLEFLRAHPEGIEGDLVRLGAQVSEKSKFKELAEKFLRTTAKFAGLTDFEVHFNPGGSAVSGEAYLYSDRVFVMICANSSHGVLYRRCVRKQDPPPTPGKRAKRVKPTYSSSAFGNQWFPFEDLCSPERVLHHLRPFLA